MFTKNTQSSPRYFLTYYPFLIGVCISEAPSMFPCKFSAISLCDHLLLLPTIFFVWCFLTLPLHVVSQPYVINYTNLVCEVLSFMADRGRFETDGIIADVNFHSKLYTYSFLQLVLFKIFVLKQMAPLPMWISTANFYTYSFLQLVLFKIFVVRSEITNCKNTYRRPQVGLS